MNINLVVWGMKNMELMKNKLYNLMLGKTKISYNDLKRLGFSIETISSLLESGFLVVIEEDLYEVSSESLCQYGLELFNEKKYELANKCFKNCLDRGYFCYESILALFCNSLLKNEFDECYKLLGYLYKLGDRESKVANLYLYLLNSFCDCPRGYETRVSDLVVSENNLAISISDSEQGRLVVRKILAGEKHALAIDGVCSGNEKKILRNLLHRVSTLKKDFALINLVRIRSYEELKAKLEKRNLEISDIAISYCIKIIDDILAIYESGIIPEKIENNCTKAFGAIDNKDYSEALMLNCWYCRKNNRRFNDIFSYLLFDINEMIGSIRKNGKLVLNNAPDRITVPYLERLLFNEEYEKFLSVLGRYLRETGNADMFDLVCEFTKLSIVKGKNDYKHVVNCLIKIISGEFSREGYYTKVLEYFNNRNFLEAEIGLNICKLCGGFDDSVGIADTLEQLKSATDYPTFGQARFEAFEESKRNDVISRYNKFCLLCDVRKQLFSQVEAFIRSDSDKQFLSFNVMWDDVNLLKNDAWYICGQVSILDIKIFSSSDKSVVYLRKLNEKADESLYEGFASIGGFVDSLKTSFNNGEYLKCIDEINSLLKTNRFAINGNKVIVEIYLLLINSYLRVFSRCRSVDEKKQLCDLVSNYLMLISVINESSKLGYSKDIYLASQKLEECKNSVDSFSTSDVNLEKEAEEHADSIYAGGFELEGYINKYINSTNGTDSSILAWMIRIAYAFKYSSKAERKQLIKKVQSNAGNISEVKIYLDVMRAKYSDGKHLLQLGVKN